MAVRSVKPTIPVLAGAGLDNAQMLRKLSCICFFGRRQDLALAPRKSSN